MSIFNLIKKKEPINNGQAPQNPATAQSANLANLVLNSIDEGVMIVHSSGIVVLVNPAAMRLLGTSDPNMVENLQLASILNLENSEGAKIEDDVNPVLRAVMNGENFETRDLILVSVQEQRRPVAISVVCTTTGQNERIITLRDIARELEEEGEQADFISTASHEMRTPVASIEGYLGLALNPKTATIDERARKYLEEAHASSKHLGRLFKDLLDVTKLDDKKIRVQLTPVEMASTVRSIANGQVPMMSEKGIHYTFGANAARSDNTTRVVNQEVYASVDIDFLREAVNNLVENAIKYTASGGGIWVNVRGDDDRVLINVTDTGIGISPDDLKHVFQKFYRADNSQTRTVGGTGLGLYLVKQRVEAMGGKVWAESSFGEGSTFYLSFPRITAEEYQRRKQIASNIEAMSQNTQTLPTQPTMQDPQAAISQPMMQPTTQPEVVQSPIQQTPQPMTIQSPTQQTPQPSIQETTPIQSSQPVVPQGLQSVAQPTIQQSAMTQFSQPVTQQPPAMQQPALSQPVQLSQPNMQPLQPPQQPLQSPHQPLQTAATQPLNNPQPTSDNQQLPNNN
ncbi:ATP-binding protein [Candidatus Nanosyncoccus nanoralicus]|uniref:histidine kinase n=1 Tax=Candidatus Nanosyncoccus nanoralicus TaxID=2171996 RepID=A0ABY0FM07_9BACT|nr:ATP-binding protein [Candidatus Nanosyncoccus nanoralicus]RYC73814.1 Sensor histidine kinase WalK [Candidatus Nanosyncoccus nanoralicus]